MPNAVSYQSTFTSVLQQSTFDTSFAFQWKDRPSNVLCQMRKIQLLRKSRVTLEATC